MLEGWFLNCVLLACLGRWVFQTLRYFGTPYYTRSDTLFNIFTDKADKNGNGKISVAEYIQIFSDHGIPISQEEVAKISSLADDDDEVTKEEFMHYAKNSDFFKAQMDKSSANSMAAKEEAIAKAERAFKVFDKDNDGFITKDEFAKISKKLNRDQVNAVFNKFDKDGDGVLSFEEFRRMLNKDKKWKNKT